MINLKFFVAVLLVLFLNFALVKFIVPVPDVYIEEKITRVASGEKNITRFPLGGSLRNN